MFELLFEYIFEYILTRPEFPMNEVDAAGMDGIGRPKVLGGLAGWLSCWWASKL